jgi:diamine N-acetyltransferase
VATWIESARDCERWAGPRVSYPLDLDQLAAQIAMDDALNVALLDEGGLVGFGQALPRGCERAHLTRIIVRPDARGVGLGRELTQALLDRAAAAGMTTATLYVYRDNAGATHLYEALGFEQAASPPGEQPSPDTLFMRRAVRPGRVEVVQATAADAPLLAELGARTFRDTFGADNTEADMDLYLAGAFSPEIQTRELSDQGTLFLVAKVDGVPAGYTRLRFGDAPACVGGTLPVELARFYVDLPWIGRGVAASLMDAALEVADARRCDIVWLDVWERNPRAIRFYSKWGFSVVGSQGFLLGDDMQNDLLMARTVAGGHA